MRSTTSGVDQYGRYRGLDVHRERLVNKKGSPAPSSLPPVKTKYENTWATFINDAEGDALIISSMRIDKPLLRSVGGTTVNFDLEYDNALTTSVFLDADSIRKANSLSSIHGTKMINGLDILH